MSQVGPPVSRPALPEPIARLDRVQWTGLILGPLLFFVIGFGPMPPELGASGQRALGIMALCATWWLTTPVALPVTSMFGLALLPLLGVLDKNRSMELFGNQAVFFVIAAFIFAAVSVRTGLSARIALWALRRVGHSEDKVAGGTLVVAAMLTSVVISHAVAALLLPIVIEIIRAQNLGPGSRFARRLLLSMAWGTICGSNISLLSSARASLSTGLYSSWMAKHAGATELTEIGFFEYSAATFGPMLISLGLAYVILRWFHRPEGISVDAAVKRLEERSRELGRVSKNERITAVAIVSLVVCMVIWGKQYGIGSIALAGTALLFAARTATWEDVEGYVNWGVVLLYGGAIAVAAAIEETKAVDVLVTNYVPLHALPVWVVIALCAVLTVLITAFVSNAAAIALLLPICLTIANELAINPRAMAILLPIAAGLDFSLPVSTPAMAMVFGTGYLRTQDSVIPGVLLSIVATSLTIAFTAFFWPYLGLPLVGG